MEALGIDPVLLTAQLVSFLTLLAVLNHFLYKKLRQSLKERREMVATTVRQNEEVAKKLAQIDLERESLKKKNQAEIKQLLAESQAAAETIKQETLAETEKKAAKLLEQAKSQIEQENRAAAESLRAQARNLAREMTAKVLEDVKENKTLQKQIIDHSLKNL